MKQLDQIMEELYKCQTGQARMIIAGTKKIRHPEKHRHSVLTYAEILSNKFKQPPSKESTKSVPTPSPSYPATEEKSTPRVLEKMPSDNETQKTYKGTNDIRNEQRMQEFSNLIQKIDRMASQQDKLEKAQANLQQDQERHKKMVLTKINQADERNTDEMINEMIEQKLTTIQEAHETRLQETKLSLKQEIDTALDKKISQLSDTVATQVGTQILEMFKQFMIPTENTEGMEITEYKTTSMITQDGPTTHTQVGLEGDENSSPLDTTNDTTMEVQMTDTLYNQKIPSKQSCSPHDTNLNEQLSKKT